MVSGAGWEYYILYTTIDDFTHGFFFYLKTNTAVKEILNEEDIAAMSSHFIETLFIKNFAKKLSKTTLDKYNNNEILLLIDPQKASNFTFESQRRCLFYSLNTIFLKIKSSCLHHPVNSYTILVYIFIDHDTSMQTDVTTPTNSITGSLSGIQQYYFDIFDSFPIRIHPTINVILQSIGLGFLTYQEEATIQVMKLFNVSSKEFISFHTITSNKQFISLFSKYDINKDMIQNILGHRWIIEKNYNYEHMLE